MFFLIFLLGMTHAIIPEGAVQPITDAGIKELWDQGKIQNHEENWGIANSLAIPHVLFKGEFRGNGFLSAVHASFHHHIPLKIAPDDIWMVFLSQVARRVNENPEKYRSSLVCFEGKQLVDVRADNLVLDEPALTATPKWAAVFPQFEEKMKETMKIPIQLRFTTTTTNSYIASQMMIMNTLKRFYDYSVTTMCGIPEVTILGTIQDWETLWQKVEEISKIVDYSWFDRFSPFINQAILVLEGKGDPSFFANLYHWNSFHGSGGGTFISGEILKLFPINDKGDKRRDTGSFPALEGYTPFTWNYLSKTLHANFHSGLNEVLFEDGAVRPLATWKVSFA